MLRCILFDFGGTLDCDGQAWLERFYPLFVQAGAASDFKQFQNAYFQADDALPARHDLSAASLEKTLRLLVQDLLAIMAPTKSLLAPQIAGAFLSQSRQHLARNRAVLERLKKRYVLAVVSNFYGNMDSVLRGEGLREFFGAVADSGAVGAQKPESRIFQCAMQGAGVSASECLMVGDSLSRDMRGAEGLGMAHAWVSQAGSICCAEGKKISALPDVEALLA